MRQHRNYGILHSIIMTMNTNKSDPTLIMLARVGGILALVLGFSCYTGARDLIPFHIAISCLLLVAVWGLAIQIRARNVRLALVSAGVGVILPVLGLTQAHLSIGGHHAILRLLHVLAGLSAIALAEIMAKRLKKSAA